MKKQTAMSAWEVFLPVMPDRVLADESQRRSVQHVFFSGMLAAMGILDPDMSTNRAKELVEEIAEIMGPDESDDQ